MGAGRGLVFGLLLETMPEVMLGIALGWGIASLGSGVLGERLGFFLPTQQFSAEMMLRV